MDKINIPSEIIVENNTADKFIKNKHKSIFIFPNPDSSKVPAFWVSLYDYKKDKAYYQRVVSRPTLDALININFYN